VLSSISSSERSFLFPLRVGLAAALIVLAYNGLIAAARPDLEVSYDAGTRNRGIAERYIDQWSGDGVLVGSSLAALLSKEYMRTDELGPNIFNLGLTGGHAATGLDIIIRKQKWPRVVLVEMNVMDRGYDPDFSRDRFAEPWRSIRSAIPGLRFENRPIDLGIVALWRLFRDRVRGGATTQAAFTAKPDVVGGEKQSLDEATRRQIEVSLDKLKEQLAVLRDHNVRTILVHFPVAPAVEGAARTRYVWRQAGSAFPPEQYEWLEVGASGSYETTDGEHLTIASAQRFAATLRTVADQAVARPSR
jgi:hypothetical protein